MTGRRRAEPSPALNVGQVAARLDVTVRTLHHYHEVGLVCPSTRSPAGYRLYTDEDLARLQHVVVYRRLGFSLEEIVLLLDDPAPDLLAHLRRQRAAVQTRLEETRRLLAAIDRALEVEMSGIPLSAEEQRELFGDGYSEELAAEAEQRWGDTDAWRQSAGRTSRYTREDWVQIRAEMDAVNAELVASKQAGEPAAGVRAMDAAERHRLHVNDRFYDLGHEFHRALGDMYVADPRFAKGYEDLEPGLASYLRDAIHANADRHGLHRPDAVPV